MINENENKAALLTDGVKPSRKSTLNGKLTFGILLISVISLILGIVSISKITGPQGTQMNSAFSDVYAIPAKNYAVEGFYYDSTSQQFLVGSVRHKSILAISPHQYSDLKSSISRFWTNDGAVVDAGVLGVHVDSQDDRYVLWAALFNFPGTRDAGVLRYDMITGEFKVFNLAGLSGSDSNIINDIVALPDGTVFITNTRNGQIFKLYYNTTSGSAIGPELFVNDPNLVPAVGFDGIEYVDGYLLVGLFEKAEAGGRLMRINTLDSKDVINVSINGGTLDLIDGIRFNRDRSKLYAIKQPSRLVILQSNDNWKSANILQEIDVSTKPGFSKTITAVTLIPDQVSNGPDKVYVLSADGFGAGPYSIIRVL
jgi:hypothetical protein